MLIVWYNSHYQHRQGLRNLPQMLPHQWQIYSLTATTVRQHQSQSKISVISTKYQTLVLHLPVLLRTPISQSTQLGSEPGGFLLILINFDYIVFLFHSINLFQIVFVFDTRSFFLTSYHQVIVFSSYETFHYICIYTYRNIDVEPCQSIFTYQKHIQQSKIIFILEMILHPKTIWVLWYDNFELLVHWCYELVL